MDIWLINFMVDAFIDELIYALFTMPWSIIYLVLYLLQVMQVGTWYPSYMDKNVDTFLGLDINTLE